MARAVEALRHHRLLLLDFARVFVRSTRAAAGVFIPSWHLKTARSFRKISTTDCEKKEAFHMIAVRSARRKALCISFTATDRQRKARKYVVLCPDLVPLERQTTISSRCMRLAITRAFLKSAGESASPQKSTSDACSSGTGH